MKESVAVNMNSDLKILEIDPWLAPYKQDLTDRMKRYDETKQALLRPGQSLSDFANGHHYFGFHQTEGGWYYREWAPEADALFLIGDFNNWDKQSHPLQKKEDGCWEIYIEGRETLTHGSRVKVHVIHNEIGRDRIPLYIKKVVQDEKTKDFSGQIWEPEQAFQWTDQHLQLDPSTAPLIYEVHIGMAQEKEAIATYKEFEEKMLPRIKDLGYNTIQIMAIMEHPYYASFGYQVANYFAPSSWFGTPEDLKSLINTAHNMGIAVLMDIVQSHAVKNTAEGINEFDGTEYQFFHAGDRGNHPAWGSKLFNYGKREVIHFLLSNIKYWLEEYHFDGFRFDGVTSMIYHDNGLGTDFDHYEKYFSMNTDVDAITYLQLANELIKEIKPNAITVAEDMSGMPGMCLPIEYGGIGFDYRLAMGVPDFWVDILESKDEDWNMHRMWHELTTSRPAEKRIAYAESHDQALVGDKTLIFRMADKEMYWAMDKQSENLLVDRAVALHKMIRLITISLGAEGYLNFMGNEFGHPEWIDFPREGNNWSFHHCRRLWSLVDDENLRYGGLNDFDRAMIHFMRDFDLMGSSEMKNLWIDEEKKIIAYKKKGYVFLFNFHPANSYEELEIPIHEDARLKVILDTDEYRFGGFGRIAHDPVYETAHLSFNERDKGIAIYAPARTAMVLGKVE